MHIGDKPIVLISKDDVEDIDLENITSIDYSNLYGEAVTISALIAKVGIWKAQAEKNLGKAEFELDIYESAFKKKLRGEAQVSGGKFTIDGEDIKLTESSLKEAVILDHTFIEKQNEILELKHDAAVIDNLMWALQGKSSKLNNITMKVTPQEFVSELVEGKVNTIYIKKF